MALSDETKTLLVEYALEDPPSRSRPRIEWKDDEGPKSLAIDRVMTLGSAPSGEIVVTDRAVSRLHAELAPAEDGLWVRDLASRNGTYIEGIRIERARVPDGATIRAGNVDLRVTYLAPAADAELSPQPFFGGLLGRSAAMRELFSTLAKIAKTDSSVLVTGETGTGKELVAQAIHDASTRAGGPFVVVDCGALPENLIESELFGHARGAFTGALTARSGAFESAHGGTIFLDEIGELPLALQPKLLRALESRTVRRLGETQHRAIDVRIVAATHRDLRAQVNRGAFREDLFFRLAVLGVRLPPLRERRADVPLLLDHFMTKLGALRLSAAEKAALADRPWLGNVRELRNVAERIVALGTTRALAMEEEAPAAAPSPPPNVGAPQDEPATPPTRGLPALDPTWFDRGFREFRDSWNEAGEREYLRRLLARHHGNYAQAASDAELERSYFYRIAKRYGL